MSVNTRSSLCVCEVFSMFLIVALQFWIIFTVLGVWQDIWFLWYLLYTESVQANRGFARPLDSTKVEFPTYMYNISICFTAFSCIFQLDVGDSIDALNTYSTICRCNFASKTAASFWTLILWEAGTISFFYLSQDLSCRRLCSFPARDWQLIATKPPFFGSS